jgi:selenium metabolism protein YedF
MHTQLDCRRLACPGPVLQAKEIIEKKNPGNITVIVDNEAARQNVTRFLESQHFQVTAAQEGPDFHVSGARDSFAAMEVPLEEKPRTDEKRIMVMVATDRMGQGDDTLGAALMINFLKTLKEMEKELWRLVFVNNGVKLTIDGSEALPDLSALEDHGVTILVCGTCLNHFKLLDRKQVGETTNMLDIVTAMQLADKVINI